MSSQNFKPGNIRRIYLQNFLTYDEIEVFPSPHLNVIIGPNTTGKSSILCAICIGLAGKPEVTGRGKHITEYIKHGKDDATIEIELNNVKGTNPVIIRKFTQSGKSIWKLNGRETTQKNIEEGIKKLGICINNLCQFLPQDRVSEFAKLNKIDLLLSTEKAVGENELAEHHALLCSHAHETSSLKITLSDLQKQLNDEIKKNEQIEGQVENAMKRKEIEKRIRNLKILKRIFQIEKYRCEMDGLKKRQSDLAKELSLLERRMEPCQKEISKIEAQSKKIVQECSHRLQQSKKLENEIYKIESRYTERSDMIENAIQNYASSKDSHEKNLKTIQDLKRQKLVLQNQLKDSEDFDEEQLVVDIKTVTQEISATSRNLTDNIARLEEATSNIRQTNLRKTLKEKEVATMKNVKQRRLNLLVSDMRNRGRKLNKDTFEAAQWLESNRAKFQHNVYLPMFCEIDVPSQYAKYVEAAIPQRDLLAFVCESKDDLNSLKKIADQYRWTINIIHSYEEDLNFYLPPRAIEEIQHCGFCTYLKDAIKAPVAITSYLCRVTKVHLKPIALGEVQMDHVPPQITVYYAGSEHYVRSYSKYDNQLSTKVNSVRQVNLLRISSISIDFQKLERDVAELDERILHFSQTENTLDQEKSSIERILEELRTKKRTLTEQKDAKQQIQERIRQKGAQIERREKNIEDLDAAETLMKEKIEESHIKMKEMIKGTSQISDRLKVYSIEDLRATFKNIKLLQNKETHLKEAEEDKEAYDGKKAEISQVEDEYKEVRSRSKYLKEELVTNHKINPEEFETIKRGFKEQNLECVEEELAKGEALKECLLVSSDEAILGEYERRKIKINKLKKDIKRQEDFILNKDTRIEDIKNSWVPNITKLTEKISDNFSSFMEKLDCAGQVVLEKGPHESDFSKYGLGIKVKFRDAEKLSDLTAHQQSGGERSVSTALYLLSLQKLTAVPFRCVDEINQGMDATNERNMFTMLVDSTSQDNASQYFLVTPKLLPNLHYNPRVNFLTVFNGKRMVRYNYCKTKKVLANMKKM